jgi:hypothetical protein
MNKSKHRESKSFKLKQVGKMVLQTLSEHEKPSVMKGPNSSKFIGLMLAANICEFYKDRHSVYFDEAFRCVSFLPLYSFFTLFNLFLIETQLKFMKLDDLQAQNIWLKYLREVCISKLQFKDQNLDKILMCITRIIRRNRTIIVASAEKGYSYEHKEVLCLEHCGK